MALPEWIDRLRTASYESPSGVVSTCKLDILTRIGGKKISNHEILNTDDNIPQDQGNRARRYPCDFYFTGDNGDQEANALFESLHEEYTVAAPGILRHPVWGNIPVFPFSDPQETHNLVNAGGIFRVSVEFISVPETLFPTAGGFDQSEIVSDIDNLEDTLAAANESIDIDDPGRFAEFRAKILSIVDIVSDSLSSVAELADDIQDRFRQTQSDINSVLQIGADAVEILSQVNNLIRLPGQLRDVTISKIQAYATMSQGIADSFLGFFTGDGDRQTQLNDALTLQNTFGIATAALAEAALFTDYETRDQAADVLDTINAQLDQYENGASAIAGVLDGLVTDLFAPDHDTALGLNLIAGKTTAILLDRSFSLKARRNIILTEESDVITLTWKYYESVENDAIEFFIRTNNLNDIDMAGIPAGREIVVYA
jgi:hypothetical protein